MKKPIIGILGGMGPRATVDFENRLLAQFHGTDQNIPTIITINDGSIPDRTNFILGAGPDPVPKLLQNAETLLSCGAQIICMPCNTAHSQIILGRLQELIDIPIIDMPKACMDFAAEQKARRVLILGTDGTRVSNVFSERSSKTRCVYPGRETQQLVLQIIATIKRGQRVSDTQIFQLQQGIMEKPTDLIFLACTELGTIQTRLHDQRIVDSLDILANRCADTVRVLYTKRKEAVYDTRYTHDR